MNALPGPIVKVCSSLKIIDLARGLSEGKRQCKLFLADPSSPLHIISSKTFAEPSAAFLTLLRWLSLLVGKRLRLLELVNSSPLHESFWQPLSHGGLDQ